MARKPNAQRRRAKEAKAPAPAPAAVPPVISPRVIVDVDEATPIYYVNYIEFTSTNNEFALTATRLPAKLSQEKIQDISETGEFRLDASVQLLIPLPLVKGVVQALQTHIELFEQQHGPIPSAAEGGKSGTH